MTDYNELIGRHLVLVSMKKGENPEIMMSVDGTIEEVDATTSASLVYFRINGEWASCNNRADIDEALTKRGKERHFDGYYCYFKIV